eukprot:3044081-Rhodomonas_salina.2
MTSEGGACCVSAGGAMSVNHHAMLSSTGIYNDAMSVTVIARTSRSNAPVWRNPAVLNPENPAWGQHER